MRYPDATGQAHLETSAGIGGVVAEKGAPARVPRFPGDPAGEEHPERRLPRVPDTSDPNVPKPVRTPVEQVIQQTILEDGEQKAAIAGYLFFAYKGNVKKIKSVELLYNDGAGGVATLRLQ